MCVLFLVPVWPFRGCFVPFAAFELPQIFPIYTIKHCENKHWENDLIFTFQQRMEILLCQAPLSKKNRAGHKWSCESDHRVKQKHCGHPVHKCRFFFAKTRVCLTCNVGEAIPQRFYIFFFILPAKTVLSPRAHGWGLAPPYTAHNVQSVHHPWKCKPLMHENRCEDYLQSVPIQIQNYIGNCCARCSLSSETQKSSR